jgi:putative copper resistance protein D
VSALLWLVFEAAEMSGTGFVHALDPATVGVVLRETEFGHVWSLRFVLLALMAIAWVPIAVTRDRARRIQWMPFTLPAAVLYAASLAWAGHAAAAMTGTWRAWHLASDSSHLLAAGAWLGALPLLAHCLRSAQPNDALARLAKRFSVMGIASVGVLSVSGIANACFLVASIAALIGTPYGRLLLVKVSLFVVLLGIAVINRERLTPRLADAQGDARRRLHRNVVLEIAGGIAIVGIVGALGTRVPAAHQSPVWPLPFRLDFSLAETSGARHMLAASSAVALAAALLIIAGMRRHPHRVWLAGVVALLAATAGFVWALAAPAFPTTYAASPVPYATDAVARGAARFASECAGCHGEEGRGDGPLAASLPTKPANLAEHAMHHPPGNLFWWIAHGIEGTPMPAFAPRLADREIWELVQFITARAAAEAAMPIDTRIVRARMRVPDFAYERAGKGQQTLAQRGAPTLIVLYSLPLSAKRLAALAGAHELMHANVAVIAIPFSPNDAADNAPGARTDADVASVYAMFVRARDRPLPAHAELLVDANGFLRARWIGVPASDAKQNDAIAAAAAELARSPAAAKAPTHPHGH